MRKFTLKYFRYYLLGLSVSYASLVVNFAYADFKQSLATTDKSCLTENDSVLIRFFPFLKPACTHNEQFYSRPYKSILFPTHHSAYKSKANHLIQNPFGTTLSRSIGIKKTNQTDNYKRLVYDKGWPLVIRQDLAPAKKVRSHRRESLVSFIHLTDMHITDAQSPERNPFARKFGIDYRTDFRNQEALTLQVAESMVRRVNSLNGGVATGEPFGFVISTGDNGDGRQMNELRNYINLLDGGFVYADSSGQGYVGVQDDYFLPANPEIYDQYYHPDPPPPGAQPDQFKREYGFPEYPGLLQAASRDFQATGLKLPWYSTHGNHDGTVIGFFRALEEQLILYWDQIATGNIPVLGSQMFLDLPAGMTIEMFEDCLSAPTVICVDSIYQNRIMRPIPANEDRAQYLTAQFLDMHFDSPAVPGPVGHGFTDQNRQDQTLYYSFDMGAGIKGIVLDTVDISGDASGSMGTIQFQWLQQQLQAFSSQYLDSDGNIVTTGNVDQLIVLFSHHNLQTMDNSTSLPGDPDPVKVLGPEILSTVLDYPNVILWVNGHSHVNRIWSHSSFNSAAFLIPAFWELNTASHIDYPQQARSIEIVDNHDGTLSIFAVLIDHLAHPKTNPNRLDALGMASISREISVNDPDFNIDFQLGAPADRNVELLVNKPF